jgi:hypothetical protein
VGQAALVGLCPNWMNLDRYVNFLLPHFHNILSEGEARHGCEHL